MRTTQSLESLGLLERLELKFHIPETMVKPISEYVSIYCSPDKYSRDAEEGVYTVNSLYFDTYEVGCLTDNLFGVSDRTKLRFRWYGDDFRRVRGHLELKGKSNQLGWKEGQLYLSSGARLDRGLDRETRARHPEHVPRPPGEGGPSRVYRLDPQTGKATHEPIPALDIVNTSFDGEYYVVVEKHEKKITIKLY